jgi:hypothetical protein
MADPLTNTRNLASQLASERDGVSFALALAACALSAMCSATVSCRVCPLWGSDDDPFHGLCPARKDPEGWLRWLTWLTREGSEG